MLPFTISCEDVIAIETPSEEPRLIIEALIKIDEDAPTTTASVTVRLSDSFFGSIPLTDLTDITITNLGEPEEIDPYDSNGFIILLETAPGSGTYERDAPTSFFTEGELLLQLTHNEQLYFAKTTYVPTVPIDALAQGDGVLFDDEETEVVVTFTDHPERDDFYVFDFDFGEFLVTEDEFYQGQEFSFSYFYDQRLDPMQDLEISILGADRAFHTYMGKLIEQSNQDLGVFETPSATVRGNIINVSTIDNMDNFDNVDQTDNFALGYFAVVQAFKRTLRIQ